MRLGFFQPWNAWWIVTGGPVTCTLLYGPFNDKEALLAASIHNVEMPAELLR